MQPTDTTLIDGYKGICRYGRYSGGGRKYHARINLNNKQRLLGPFHDAVEAAKCYDFALNFFYDNLRRKPRDAKFNAGNRNRALETTDDTSEYERLCQILKINIESAELAGAPLPTFEAGEQSARLLNTSDALKEILATQQILLANQQALLAQVAALRTELTWVSDRKPARETCKSQVEKIFIPTLPHETT